MSREVIDVWAKRHDGEVHKVLDGHTIDGVEHVLTDHDRANAMWLYKAVGEGLSYVSLCDEHGGCESKTLEEYKEKANG